MPCPICGQKLTTFGSRSQMFVDCPSHHRATTPPERWREAYVRARLAEIEAVTNPGSGPGCAAHDWVVIEQVPSMNLLECSLCSAWIMGSPG